jgi:hypothetical protein
MALSTTGSVPCPGMMGRYLPGTDSTSRMACSVVVGLMPMATPTARIAKPTTTMAAMVLPNNNTRGRAAEVGVSSVSSVSSGSFV